MISIVAIVAIVAIVTIVAVVISVAIIAVITVAIISVVILVAIIAVVVAVPRIPVVISIAIISIVMLVLVEGLKILFVGFIGVIAPVEAFPLGLNVVLAHGFQRGHIFGVIEIVYVVILHRQSRSLLGHWVPVSVPGELAVVVSGHVLALGGHQGLPLFLVHIFLVVAEPISVHEVVEQDQPDHRKDDNQQDKGGNNKEGNCEDSFPIFFLGCVVL